MKIFRPAATAIVSLALAACTSVPPRQDRVDVATAVTRAGLGAPRLPAAGEGYLSAAWFEAPLTPDRAVQGALLNNPRVRAELARLDAAQAERIQAGLLRNPMASLMALRPEGGGRLELEYSLMFNLFDLFARSRRIDAADAAQRQVEADVIGRLVAIAQDTQDSYYAAVIAAAKRQVRREQQAVDDEILRLLQAQARQGAVSSTAVLAQQAIASMQAHEVASADAALIQATAALARQLGLPSAKALALPDALPAFVFPGLDAPALQALAMARNPGLQAASAAVERARVERELQSGMLRTADPTVGPKGMRETGGMTLAGVDLQVLLPVFDTGQARRDLAGAQVAQAEFVAEAVRRQVPLEVERSLGTLVAADLAAGHADHHLVQQEQLQRLARRNYEQGVADRATYLQARRSRLDSVMQRLDAHKARWTALVDMERATGAATLVEASASP